MNINDIGRKHKKVTIAVAGLLASLIFTPASYAFEIETGNPEFKARWDNNIKYSAAWRVRDRLDSILARANSDDGDRNFGKGLISNRVDLLSELDLSYKKDFGVRVSAATWYDAVYQSSNDNNSPATVNYTSVPNNEFPKATKDLHGQRAEVLDAFVYGSGSLGDMPATFRIGRHTLLWGESLLMADNGLSYVQAPLDLMKIMSVPGSQAKEVFMPVGQVSGQLGLTPRLSIAAYYQYEWNRIRFPGPGSYFNTLDFYDAGAQRIFLGRTPLGRQPDVGGRDSGQWGISTRYRADSIDTEFGLYYIRFHEKQPQIYVQPSKLSYFIIFPEDITAIGASATTTVGSLNLGGEVHVRRNNAFVSSVVLPAGVQPDINNPLYAVGNSAHAQVNALYVLPNTDLWDSASMVAELGGHHVTSITKNPSARDRTRNLTAWGLRVGFTPTYFQVKPGLDVSVPISLAYNPKGKSPVFGSFNGGGNKGGSMTVGLSSVYQIVWSSSIQLTHYWGNDDFQTKKDRDFVSMQIQRSF